ncbi:MAG: four helix bundle protein [Planctomycetota bacterium]|jgi:hypothetical protein
MTLSQTHFSHERLDAFHAALDLVEGVERIAAGFPEGYSHLKDQLRRSAAAALGNIVEGANRMSPRDKSSRFQVAHGETGECAGWLSRWPPGRSSPLPSRSTNHSAPPTGSAR